MSSAKHLRVWQLHSATLTLALSLREREHTESDLHFLWAATAMMSVMLSSVMHSGGSVIMGVYVVRGRSTLCVMERSVELNSSIRSFIRAMCTPSTSASGSILSAPSSVLRRYKPVFRRDRFILPGRKLGVVVHTGAFLDSTH